jgi:tripartite motif-containing protein 2/3
MCILVTGVYNGVDHIPKLLPCSHTVCLDCLNRIADVRSREIGVFRCPICRELTNIPQGGISALPPSFLVNRLLDLMSRQRRHIIPTCSDHSNQVSILYPQESEYPSSYTHTHTDETFNIFQILYTCETCDVIFCILCQNGASHKPISEESKNCEHTIVPYSVAIKRMAEILIYKANECLSKVSNKSLMTKRKHRIMAAS